MSSSAQIVTRALKRLKIVEPQESPSADEAADGLAALNAMIAGWQADGVNISSDVPLPAKHEEGVVALLALRLAPDYGATPGASVLLDAKRGWSRLQADYLSAPMARFDRALTRMPSQQIVELDDVEDWAASTSYSVGNKVKANRKVYECVVAGTSASSGDGPNGTGPEITDNTVTWRFWSFVD